MALQMVPFLARLFQVSNAGVNFVIIFIVLVVNDDIIR
jgi:hypothetical protein